MPSLARLTKLSYDKVLRQLCQLRNSMFRGENELELRHHVSPNKARRYLALLSVVNDPSRSIDDVVSEVNSLYEDSFLHLSSGRRPKS